ncbi:sugar ABC transporter permease [Actinomadura sp. KC216]|uniref:sugar ABC transporter permease n=1 Tax=Actinomadura sp. KC216 TaxID=2530370 RepID=UPI0010428F7C|nr:sugar ABC transporter permease [Actinomadura sp. KC216]TDB91933.1 sugar ABC transporter permease [Actinomadura sp. KC216]
MSWAERALTEVLDRVGAVERELGTRWPLYADPVSGRWTTTARGSWTGGFWAGLLWLRSIVTGDPSDRAAARRRTGMLAPWLQADTATRGLIFWYGTALGGDETAALRAEAARMCLAAHDPRLGLVPWGAAFGGPRYLARVDGLPGLPTLLRLAGPDGARAAEAHLDLQLGLTLNTPDLRPAWQATPDGTWKPHPTPPPGWSRTTGWLCLAAAQAPGDRVRRCLEHPAVSARLAPDAPPVPAAIATSRGTPDTSAAAIEAVAALQLACRLPGPRAGRLRNRAAHVLAVLAAEHVRDGRLLDGCYDLEHDVAVRHELVWGDFFMAAGLAMLTGAIDPAAC